MSNSQNARSTLGVSVMTMISRVLGFVRIAVTTYFFGASGQADVINLTFNIPNNLRKLMAEGALSSAFIPVLSESLVKDKSGESARDIVRNIFYFQLAILVPFCLLSVIFARPLIGALLADFREPWQSELAVNLFRWFINYLLFISIAALFMGVLNSHRKFLIPAITPVLFSVFVILSIIILTPVMGVYSIVAGTLAGGVAQMLFQVPAYLKLGYDFKPRINFKSPQFRRVLRQWLPVIASSSVFTVTQVIAYRFSSALEPGSTSALSNAIVFWQLPMGIFSASIITVLFPQMSRQAALEDRPGLADSIQFGIRFLFVFLIPTMIFFLISGERMISVALERGLFSRENTVMTNRVLVFYSLGLFSAGLFNFLQRFFYANKDYKWPFGVSLSTGVLDVALSVILKETSLRVAGLALANTLAFTVGSVFYFILMLKRLGTVDARKILFTALKVVVSSVIMGAALFAFNYFTRGAWEAGGTPIRILIFFAGAVIAVGLVLFFYALLKVEMVRYIFKRGR